MDPRCLLNDGRNLTARIQAFLCPIPSRAVFSCRSFRASIDSESRDVRTKPTFSFTLVQKIEAHSEQIADQVVDAILRDPGLREMRGLLRDELSRRARDLLGNLGHWLVARDQEVAKWSEPLGHTRFEQSIPLCELSAAYRLSRKNSSTSPAPEWREPRCKYTPKESWSIRSDASSTQWFTTQPKATKQRCAIRPGIAAERFERLRAVRWIRRLGLVRSEVAWNTQTTVE